jgi:anti-sigma factor RsiW
MESTVVSQEVTASNFRVVPKIVTVYQHFSWTMLTMEAVSFSSKFIDCRKTDTASYPGTLESSPARRGTPNVCRMAATKTAYRAAGDLN